jgi:hypothetical protein
MCVGAGTLCVPAGGEAAAGGGTGGEAAPDGMIRSVSRRISLTFCTIASHSWLFETTSTDAVDPVAWLAGPAPPEPAPDAAAANWVDEVDCILTLREALTYSMR